MSSFRDTLQPRLEVLYKGHNIDRLLERIAIVTRRYGFLEKQRSWLDSFWSEKCSVLITYGDMITSPDEKPLVTLHRFLRDYMSDFSTVHILPFFPYSSDDGFSVINYLQVDSKLGDWDDIGRISQNFILAADLVLNHISSRSRWFQDYLSSVAPARGYFIEMEPGTDLSLVVRPRTSPLLTQVHTVWGERLVWTTFSRDQVDLNYKNPDLLIELLDILLRYISYGVGVIRLDAIAYIWKDVGTSCVNLDQAHLIVKILRCVVDNVAPGTLLLTETNLPHNQNISYFGKGDEAHLVYQFALPPLLLYTIQSGSAHYLRNWADSLEPPPQGCGFLNFTASHDGIGIRPLEGILNQEEIDRLVGTIKFLGGLVSSRHVEGSEKPYELNITYFDALKDPDRPEDKALQMARFICSQAIMLCLRGIPAVYFHSMIGSGNNDEGVSQTGQYRTINRKRFQDKELRESLENSENLSARVLSEYKSLLQKRHGHHAFHPDSPQEILDLPDSLFGLVRTSSSGKRVVCIYNISKSEQEIRLNDLKSLAGKKTTARDLISEKTINEVVHLASYKFCWLVV